MGQLLQFGERVEGYSHLVFNEREVRASAGILFFFALVSFMNSWLVGNFIPTKIFVIVFLVEFIIRVLLNPRYAPSLIFSRWIVRNQTPEYVGAPQKRWAWGFGLLLAITMFFLIIINDIKGPLNLLICLLCLVLLFFESAFGICLGCKVHRFFAKEDAQNCPGNSCEVKDQTPIQQIDSVQLGVLGISLILITSLILSNIPGIHSKTTGSQNITTSNHLTAQEKQTPPPTASDTEEEDPCTPPQWAIDMGHGEMWKLHHGCTQ